MPRGTITLISRLCSCLISIHLFAVKQQPVLEFQHVPISIHSKNLIFKYSLDHPRPVYWMMVHIPIYSSQSFCRRTIWKQLLQRFRRKFGIYLLFLVWVNHTSSSFAIFTSRPWFQMTRAVITNYTLELMTFSKISLHKSHQLMFLV